MVTAVVTSESADQLADRLARWTIVNATGSLFHLRFADTRRLPAIARALQPEQLADFIGPALQWRCVGRDGRSAATEGTLMLSARSVAGFWILAAMLLGLMVLT